MENYEAQPKTIVSNNQSSTVSQCRHRCRCCCCHSVVSFFDLAGWLSCWLTSSMQPIANEIQFVHFDFMHSRTPQDIHLIVIAASIDSDRFIRLSRFWSQSNCDRIEPITNRRIYGCFVNFLETIATISVWSRLWGIAQWKICFQIGFLFQIETGN